MGAAFAIQVMSGKESNVKRLMQWAFERNTNAQKWIKAIHTFSETTFRITKSGDLGKPVSRAMMAGYIFLEMNYSVDSENTSAHISDELWHLIKSIPGVLKQFTRSGQIISAEEFQHMLGFDREDQVEVVVPITGEDQEHEKQKLASVESQMLNSLQQINIAKTPADRNEAEKALNEAIQNEAELLRGNDQAETIGDELESLDEHHKSNPIVNRIKSILRNDREIIRLPRMLLQQIGIQEEDKPLAHVVIDRLRQFIRLLVTS